MARRRSAGLAVTIGKLRAELQAILRPVPAGRSGVSVTNGMVIIG